MHVIETRTTRSWHASHVLAGTAPGRTRAAGEGQGSVSSSCNNSSRDRYIHAQYVQYLKRLLNDRLSSLVLVAKVHVEEKSTSDAFLDGTRPRVGWAVKRGRGVCCRERVPLMAECREDNERVLAGKTGT